MSAFLLKRDDGDGRERMREVARIVQELEALPLDKPWRVEIEQVKSERSMQQNRYLWGVPYKLLSEATGYEAEDLHTYLLGKHFGTKLKRVPKTKHNPKGLIEIPVRTTTTDANGRRSVLGRTEFADFVEFIKRFASEKCGIVVPDPDPAYQLNREDERRAA